MSPVRPAVTVIGRRFEVGDHRLRDVLTRAAQPHEWVEAGTPEADRLLASVGLVDAPLPVVLDGDTAYVGASIETLERDWRGSIAAALTSGLPRNVLDDGDLRAAQQAASEHRWTDAAGLARAAEQFWIDVCSLNA